DLSEFEPARPYLQSCLLGRKTPAKQKNIALWVLLAAAVLLMAGLAAWQWTLARRWNAYVAALRQQPGIVVIRAEKSGSGGLIEGLKDPKAPDPSALPASFQVDPAKVRYEWQPYLSVNTPFAAARELDADINFIQRQLIRFDIGSAKLPV